MAGGTEKGVGTMSSSDMPDWPFEDVEADIHEWFYDEEEEDDWVEDDPGDAAEGEGDEDDEEGDEL
jgi:hypothetical protein